MNFRKYNVIPQISACFTSAEVGMAFRANTTPQCAGRRGPGSAWAGPSLLSHLVLPANFWHWEVGRVLGRTSFFSDSFYSCPSECCLDVRIWSLSRVKKNFKWELQLFISPFQSFCGKIQNPNGLIRLQNLFVAQLLGSFPLKRM